jgi:hypothetical protein
MSTFTPEQLESLRSLLGEYINPLVRQPITTRNGQPVYGWVGVPGGIPITNPNDPRLPPIQRVSQNTPAQQEATDDDRRYAEIRGIYRGARQGASNQFNEQGEYLQGTIGEVNQLGRAGQQQILDREKQQLAAGGAGLRARGLGNTSLYEGMRRGVGADTNRALSEHGERVTGMRVGARGQLSDFMRQRTAAETGLALAEAEPIQNRTNLYHQLQLARLERATGGSNFGSILGGIGSIAGPVLGGLLAGPAGLSSAGFGRI